MSSPTPAAIRSSPDLSRVQDGLSGTVYPAIQTLAKTPLLGAPPPDWILPTQLLADFTQVATLQRTAFHRDALNYVWLKIALDTVAGAAAQTQMFELPLGYRPPENIALIGVNGSTGAVSVIVIESSGEVRTGSALGAGESVVAYVSFLAAA